MPLEFNHFDIAYRIIGVSEQVAQLVAGCVSDLHIVESEIKWLLLDEVGCEGCYCLMEELCCSKIITQRISIHDKFPGSHYKYLAITSLVQKSITLSHWPSSAIEKLLNDKSNCINLICSNGLNSVCPSNFMLSNYLITWTH